MKGDSKQIRNFRGIVSTVHRYPWQERPKIRAQRSRLIKVNAR